MNIEVTVHANEIDLNTVVDGTIRGYDPEHDEYVTSPKTLADVIAEHVREEITKGAEWQEEKRRFREIRDEEVRKALAPVIERALTDPILPTNAYGEPTSGAPTTLRELIAKEAKRQVSARADNGYRSSSETVLGKFVREQIDAAFRNELAEIVKAEKAKVVKAVRDNAGSIIADAVKQGLNAR